MNSKLLIIPAALLSIALISAGLHAGIPEKAAITPGHDSFSAAELVKLREGDVILRRGLSLQSDLIAAWFGDREGISHCAVIVSPGAREMAGLSPARVSYGDRSPICQGHWAVIHTVNENLSGVDGVQIEDLEHFNLASREGSLIVVRPHMDEASRSRSLSAAWSLLGRALPFDNAYRLDTADRLYCSELLHEMYREADWGTGAWTTKKGILSFGSFLDRQYFTVVLSHNPAIAH